MRLPGRCALARSAKAKGCAFVSALAAMIPSVPFGLCHSAACTGWSLTGRSPFHVFHVPSISGTSFFGRSTSSSSP